MIEVGIIGGAGYTAGELIRILINHPKAHLSFVYSTSNAGNAISDIHQDLTGDCSLKFSSAIQANVDCVFLCLGHGNSSKFLAEHSFSKHTKIIDLSNDFRLTAQANSEFGNFVYGLPEYQKSDIQNAKNIANPGCFATAIQLALLPLSTEKLLTKPVHIQATTGATGAGTSLSPTSHYAWRDNNYSYYKPFTHQHLPEIQQHTNTEQLFFMPFRGNFSRGIYATLYTEINASEANLQHLYQSYYDSAPFTHVTSTPVHLKQVVNTNKCLIHLHKHNNTLLITSAIDNLLKGASGQAVQNMNLLFDLPETTGLQLKASYF